MHASPPTRGRSASGRRRVIAAFEASGSNVVQLDGVMLDAPHLTQARRIMMSFRRGSLALAGAGSRPGPQHAPTSGRARMTTGRSIMLPSNATAPAPVGGGGVEGPRAAGGHGPARAAEAPYSSLMMGHVRRVDAGGRGESQRLAALEPGPIGVEVVDLRELSHRPPSAGCPPRAPPPPRPCMAEDIHAVGPREMAPSSVGHVPRRLSIPGIDTWPESQRAGTPSALD